MKATCIKADHLQRVEVGKVYDCTNKGWAIIINGYGLAMPKEQFNEHFKTEEKQ